MPPLTGLALRRVLYRSICFRTGSDDYQYPSRRASAATTDSLPKTSNARSAPSEAASLLQRHRREPSPRGPRGGIIAHPGGLHFFAILYRSDGALDCLVSVFHE